MAQQPNFLFFITDQQRADWLGCYGHPVLRTPHIDAIAAGGTRFDNFHVASPVCMPNRASLMTGRFPSVHGLRYNGCTLPLSANTFVDVLAAGGYHTAAIGKSHLQPFSDIPADRADTLRHGPIAEAWKADPGNYAQEEPGRYTGEGRYEFDVPYYGYQHVDMVTQHGDRCGGHYQQWFREQASNWQELQDRSNQLPHNYSCPQAFRTPIPEELYPTAFVADRAMNYLRSRQETDQPFFAFVSFPDPHHPFNPPGKYWDMYAPDDFDVPLPYAAHQNPTPPMQWMHQNWRDGKGQRSPQTAMVLGDQEVREAMALTAGMIACVDDAIGNIMDCLHDTGQFDNTVVCFNSDHGDYLGDFNMLLKGSMLFRSITRVPFIWSDPADREARVSNALASTVDIGQTVLERAGLAPYFGVQGQSLLTNINGASGARDELLIEYNDGMARLGFDEPPRVRALVTNMWRYTVYAGHQWGELYDLDSDPNETNNLWNSAAHATVRAELAERLNHHLIRQMDESPRSERRA
ncbi:MAG: sulfatase-like hydrolase/transferase [Hyphomicrobiaceae bacterium]